MKKVLIITYYWPPSGGIGVQRWLRHVKHLSAMGWEPVIYTADSPEYAIYDESLIDEIPAGTVTHKLKIREPNSFLAKLSLKNKNNAVLKAQQQKAGNRTIFQKLAWYIRGNYFVPDTRVLWIKPSVKYLNTVLEKQNFDLILSTGPPHSLHLIAKQLKEIHGIPWVADFRDPWTSMDYLKEMFLTKKSIKRHQYLEESVIKQADAVVVVGRTMYNEFFDNYGVKSEIIYNGYNEPNQNKLTVELDTKFTIVHVGSFLKNRNCNDLWKTLQEITQQNPEFSKNLEIKLVGKLDPSVLESIETHELNDYLNKIDYLPYDDAQKLLFGAQILLLPIDRIPNAEFVLTGKLFEYLQAKRPILLLGPVNGDAAMIIESCAAGYCCAFNDMDKIKSTLLELHNLFLEKNNTIDPVNIDQFSGYELTKKMAHIFDELIDKRKV